MVAIHRCLASGNIIYYHGKMKENHASISRCTQEAIPGFVGRVPGEFPDSPPFLRIAVLKRTPDGYGKCSTPLRTRLNPTSGLFLASWRVRCVRMISPAEKSNLVYLPARKGSMKTIARANPVDSMLLPAGGTPGCDEDFRPIILYALPANST